MSVRSVEQWKNYLSQQDTRSRCPIWQYSEAWGEVSSESSDEWYYYSPRAGGVLRLRHDDECQEILAAHGDIRVKVSRWVYDRNRLGEIPYLTNEEFRKIERQDRLRIEQRIDRLLQCFVHLPPNVAYGLCCGANYPNRDAFQILEAATECSNEQEELAAVDNTPDFLRQRAQLDSQSKQGLPNALGGDIRLPQELDWLISATVENGWLEKHGSFIRLTPVGVRRLEELGTRSVSSGQAFVAMWFGDQVNEAWKKGIEPGITDAGYRPVRINEKEHNNKICDEIIAEIRRSQFIVCDFTCEVVQCGDRFIADSRGGVYYEAGFAQGLGIPVIWTCRADQIELVHFDTRQFNHITWTTPHELRQKLQNRISAVIGDGPSR